MDNARWVPSTVRVTTSAIYSCAVNIAGEVNKVLPTRPKSRLSGRLRAQSSKTSVTITTVLVEVNRRNLWN